MQRALVPIMMLAAGFAGCVTDDASTPPPDVLATFHPAFFIADRLVGDFATVDSVLPSGAEPHGWEPTPRDITRFASTRLVLAQGLDFEPWMASVQASLGERAPATTYLGDAVPPAERIDHGRTVDPHTWLDPVLMKWHVSAAAVALEPLFPEQRALIQERAAQLTTELDGIAASYDAGLASCDTRLIIVSHDAFAYLAQRYDFEVHAVAGLEPEAEPDGRTVAQLADTAREHNITTVFFEEAANERVAAIIAREVGASTRVLTTIEALSPDDVAAGATYVTLMQRNLAELTEAMRCQ